MSKHFRPWRIDQTQLLPASIEDYVPRGHLARFIVALVRESLDLSAIEASYTGNLGQPAFDPRMMTALLLNGYASGIYSSRRIARACEERADFMMIAAGDPPDFRTISGFRKRHLAALGGLFVQVLKLCAKAGLVKLGHVALDGSKIKANASKHKAMSYARMEARAAEFEAEVAAWLAAAEAADTAEDARHGASRTGDKLPRWVADKKARAAKIRQAKAELEAEAAAEAEAKRKAETEAEEQRHRDGRKKPGKPAAPITDDPDPKAQKNFTDPESRIMKSKDGFMQAYNGQIAVDAHAQIIVAQGVTQEAGDKQQLVPMTDAVIANMGAAPEELSADNGYCSEANLEALEARDIDGYIAAGRAKHAVDPVTGSAMDAVAVDARNASQTRADQSAPVPAEPPTRVEAMREKIRAGGHQSPYRLRKQLPEPVFGQIKQARGFRQFLLRGVENVRAEWAIVCTAHNLLKLAKGKTLFMSGPTVEAASTAA